VKVARTALKQKRKEVYAEDHLLCPNCTKVYTMCQRTHWSAHKFSCDGPKKKRLTATELVEEHLGVVQREKEAEASVAKTETRCLTFPGAAVFRQEITLAATLADGFPMVQQVSADSRLPVCVLVAPGCLVTHVNNDSLEDTSQDLEDVLRAVVAPFTVTFVLPPPPMLARGWARNVTRNKKMELTEEQETFLWKLWDPNRKVTAAVLREAMDTHFAGRQELQLLEFEVQRWLDGVYRQAKANDKAKEDKAKGTGEDDVVMYDDDAGAGGRGRGSGPGRGRGRGRGGRGRAGAAVVASTETVPAVAAAPKRKRGRPPAAPTSMEESAAALAAAAAAGAWTEPVPAVADVPKRKRGRPPAARTSMEEPAATVAVAAAAAALTETAAAAAPPLKRNRGSPAAAASMEESAAAPAAATALKPRRGRRAAVVEYSSDNDNDYDGGSG
jgi:hypothetical protein